MPSKKSSKSSKKKTVKRKSTRKRATKRKTTRKRATRRKATPNVNVQKLESIATQMEKVSISLIQSNHQLNSRIDKLVTLFETAVKNVGISDEKSSDRDSIRELSNKIEDLLDQNKNLAEGLLLLERYVRNKSATMSTLDAKPLPKL